MRRTCCHSFLVFILKFLNLFQLFVGLSIVLYSTCMLNQWNKHLLHSSGEISTILNTDWVYDQVIHLKFADSMINDSCSPWIRCFALLYLLQGHIAAAAINGCYLRFYVVMKTVFIVLEVSLVLFIALGRHWERDLPLDPTGEIDRFREFVESDAYFCKWVGITVVGVQAVCLLLAVVLRAMVNALMTHDEDDIEEDGDIRGKAWEPLLNQHVAQTSVLVTVNAKSFHCDIWSSRMREKYGLSNNMSSR